MGKCGPTPNKLIQPNADFFQCVLKAINIRDLAHGNFQMQVVNCTGHLPVITRTEISAHKSYL